MVTEKELSEQDRIDTVVHYRNLAISLGATPDQMACKYDRDLCEGKLSPKDQISPDPQYRDAWAEVERLSRLVKGAEWAAADPASDADQCPWCGAISYDNMHDPDCPAFTPEGEVK